MKKYCLIVIFLLLSVFAYAQNNEYFYSICLKSIGLKKNFELKMAFVDSLEGKAFVRYKGQTENIPLKYVSTTNDYDEDLEKELTDIGRPLPYTYTWNEVYNGKVTGQYEVSVQGAIVNSASYTRNKDKKKFDLEQVYDCE